MPLHAGEPGLLTRREEAHAVHVSLRSDHGRRAGRSGALAAGAVGAPDLSLLLYPAYYCLANGAMAALIHRRRTSMQRASSPARSLS
jgi:hypothetical protein